MPLKSSGNASVLVADVGHAEDSGAIQTNIVRIDGQHSVYVPILKQAGKSNTIQIVDGMRAAIERLVDIPASAQDRRRLRSVGLRQRRDQESAQGSTSSAWC